MRLELYEGSIEPMVTLRPNALLLEEEASYSVAHEAVGLFDLAVRLRVSNRCKTNVNASVFAEFHEFSRSEVRAIVRDDAMGDPESAGDHLEEIDHRRGSRVCDWYSFDPLGELVDSDK